MSNTKSHFLLYAAILILTTATTKPPTIQNTFSDFLQKYQRFQECIRRPLIGEGQIPFSTIKWDLAQDPFRVGAEPPRNNPVGPPRRKDGIPTIRPQYTIKDKSLNFLKLIRAKNILPIIGLSAAAAWIVHPTISASIRYITSAKFAATTINIIVIMSASMIINDLYDTPLDFINQPDRPLITGAIQPIEARIATVGLLAISEALTIRFLPRHMQIGNHLSIMGILLYTPYLKRIFLVKNLFCAGLIAYSLIFAALGAGMSYRVIGSAAGRFGSSLSKYARNCELLRTVFSVVFLSSFQKEILLDISDYEGDHVNDIPTVATKYGRYNAFMWAYIILTINIFVNTWGLLGMYGPTGILFSYFMNPLLMAIPTIYLDHYSQSSIDRYDRLSNRILFVGLLYFCGLSKLGGVADLGV